MAVIIRSYAKQRETEIIDRLKSAMDKAVLVVENQAKENVNQAPPNHPQVQTGILRSNIASEVSQEGSEIKGRIGTNIFYGKLLEHGTSHHPAYAWLFPALEMSRTKIKELLKGAKSVKTS